MPVYHYLDLDCVPRRELGAEELVRQVQAAVLADRLDGEFLAAGEDALPDSEKTFRQQASTPSGEDRSASRSVQDLRAASRGLEPLASHCAECPAALTGAAFGCVHSITLPISEAAERWLVERTGPPDTIAGQLLRASIEQLGLGDCALLDDWRAAGFLQAREAPTTGTESQQDVTADHLLHFLLMSGDLEPARALSALLFLRALSTDTEMEFGTDVVIRLINAFQIGGGEGKLPEFVFTAFPAPDDDPAVFEFKTLLLAAFRGFQLGVPVRLLMAV